MVFHISFPAEEEAGIRGSSATVTLDDGLTYDEEMVKGMKEFLSEWYDVKINNVFTEDEQKEDDAVEASKEVIEGLNLLSTLMKD